MRYRFRRSSNGYVVHWELQSDEFTLMANRTQIQIDTEDILDDILNCYNLTCFPSSLKEQQNIGNQPVLISVRKNPIMPDLCNQKLAVQVVTYAI